MSWKQKLVNAQVEVNRAVFLMNARDNRRFPEYKEVDASDDAICLHIDDAIRELKAARGGIKEMDLIGEIKKLKRNHYVNDEDCWYSCPKSGECCNEKKGSVCNCGADAYNERIDIIVKYMQQHNHEACAVCRCPHYETPELGICTFYDVYTGKCKFIA